LGARDEDAALMLAFCAGDGAAFDALFNRWAAPLLRYLERMLRDSAAAEELVQEVFLRVHGARQRYQPEARFSTWLYRIATNLALNELRRPRRREPHASLDERERQRAALCLTAVEGLSYAEVAGALEISESAVKALVHRARTALAGRVKDLE
jgi:RNA polymerase sigma-70 factor (ECF subfamily)